VAIVLDQSEPAIVRGIKTVGVGKKGSKGLDASLVQEIVADIKAGKVTPASKGAFFAGLLAKGVEPQEKILTEIISIDELTSDAPEFIRWVCKQLLEGQTLDKKTAYDLGQFLFSDQPGDGVRGLVASFLRVRYETDDEYEGLLNALVETIDKKRIPPLPSSGPIIQIAEPFDGVDHSYMITPLIGRFLTQKGFRVVHLTGQNSGPKWEMNLWDILKELGKDPIYGFIAHENELSDAFNRWNIIRRQTIKRPFMSTLERFINPYQADLVIASAFHPPYGVKMATIAKRAGFKNAIIVRNGIEGTIAFPLMREVKMLVNEQELSFENKEAVSMEERIDHPKAADNARLIKQYTQDGKTNNPLFDLRVKQTCEGLSEAIKCIGLK
jgi:anthranilate phosphoribosyltransferase